jgi:hypothetical protein
MSATEIDEGKLEAFMGQAVTDMGAIISGPLMLIGEKLGLYKAMAHAGPLTSQEVAERSGAAERYVREWLGNQAAGGYVTYDPESDRYTLPDEHALAPRSIAGITQRLDLQELVSNAHIPRLLAERAAFPAIVDRHEFLGDVGDGVVEGSDDPAFTELAECARPQRKQLADRQHLEIDGRHALIFVGDHPAPA